MRRSLARCNSKGPVEKAPWKPISGDTNTLRGGHLRKTYHDEHLFQLALTNYTGQQQSVAGSKFPRAS